MDSNQGNAARTGAPRVPAASGARDVFTCSTSVTAPLTTVHLPPDRAVLTTPGMLGLMERCLALAEAELGEQGWMSRSAEIKHRAGLSPGEIMTVTARVDQRSDREATWLMRATAHDGRLIGEGSIVRVRSQ